MATRSLLASNGVESKAAANPLDATCNWWGDRSGPTHGDNPDGDGSWAVERDGADIDVDPWLIAPSPSSACRGGQ